MGIESSELWANIGLCCFYAQQWDITLKCFERALTMASDDVAGDIWYNLGHVSLGLGDRLLAQRCWKLALATDHHHAESFNNLGVLEQSESHTRSASAKSNFSSSALHGPHLYEPHYNMALLAFMEGDLVSARTSVSKDLELYPAHSSAADLERIVEDYF